MGILPPTKLSTTIEELIDDALLYMVPRLEDGEFVPPVNLGVLVSAGVVYRWDQRGLLVEQTPDMTPYVCRLSEWPWPNV